jgi:hypothetical protein
MGNPHDKAEPDCVFRGRYGEVRFARLPDGTCPSKDFFEKLPRSSQAKFMSLFNSITSDSSLRLLNRTQFKVVEGNLFEFKRNDLQMRLFAFRDSKTWYLLCGLTGKKENELPPGEVRRALVLLEQAKRLLGR